MSVVFYIIQDKGYSIITGKCIIQLKRSILLLTYSTNIHGIHNYILNVMNVETIFES